MQVHPLSIFFFQMLEESLHLSSKYLAQEAKVESTVSRVATLEVENSKVEERFDNYYG